MLQGSSSNPQLKNGRRNTIYRRPVKQILSNLLSSSMSTRKCTISQYGKAT